MGLFDRLVEDVGHKAKAQKKRLETALSPTEMPTPGDAQVAKASQAAQRAVKKRKGRASTILTGLFGRGGLSRPVTALTGVPLPTSPPITPELLPGYPSPGNLRRPRWRRPGTRER